MPPRRLRLFGRTVEAWVDGTSAGRTLAEELALYPEAAPDAEPDLVVRLGDTAPARPLATNPSTHAEHASGFTARYTVATVAYHFEESRLRELGIQINTPRSPLWRQAQRFADMQFSTRDDRAGIVFHELALVPAAALDPERVPVHASALEAPDGSVTLFGGTGGVGKTSLCIELCLHSGHRFVADDIAVLGPDGHVFPNLAYPKIYGYNLTDNDPLREAVFAERGPLDRAHWHLHQLRGLDKVRRRAAPDVLYGSFSRAGGPVRRYVLLARGHTPTLRLDPVSPAEAAALSVSVLEAELGDFLNHLRWHAYNRRLLGMPPLATASDVASRWRSGLEKALDGAECLIARVPAGMEHGAFKRSMREALAV
ncbi:MAG: hypothetical protein AAGI91_00825 [Bacteroidota bacterium]